MKFIEDEINKLKSRKLDLYNSGKLDALVWVLVEFKRTCSTGNNFENTTLHHLIERQEFEELKCQFSKQIVELNQMCESSFRTVYKDIHDGFTALYAVIEELNNED